MEFAKMEQGLLMRALKVFASYQRDMAMREDDEDWKAFNIATAEDADELYKRIKATMR